MLRSGCVWHSRYRAFQVLGECENLSRAASKLEGRIWWNGTGDNSISISDSGEWKRAGGGGKGVHSTLTRRRMAMRPAYLVIRAAESQQLIRVWSPWHCVVRTDWRTDVLSSGASPAWTTRASQKQPTNKLDLSFNFSFQPGFFLCLIMCSRRLEAMLSYAKQSLFHHLSPCFWILLMENVSELWHLLAKPLKLDDTSSSVPRRLLGSAAHPETHQQPRLDLAIQTEPPCRLGDVLI